MSQELSKTLEKLGLSDKQAKVYVAGLKLGRFSVLALAEKTGIKRPTCYLILDELIKKGLISTYPKEKKVIYVAEHPNNLLKQAADAYATAKELMPELQNLINTNAEKPVLKVYSGQSGIQNIYEDMTDEGKDLFYFGSVKELVESVGQEFLDNWIKKRIAKGMKSKSIRIREKEMDYKLYGNSPENLRTIRYAPEGFTMPYTIYIYSKKVAFVSTKKDLFGFIVESDDLAKSMKALFDVVWNISTN
ncbi:MAG: hypothetical protein NTW62_02140 [Candidatus Nomurabacteria bacterium]|nr:hypothetical protein [Candidatus Nomurabacteria bacterium]